VAERLIYVPLFDGFFESSIMLENVTTRFVFIGLIRLAYRARSDGVVDIPLPVLAHQLFLPAQEVAEAIKVLLAPDPNSGTPEHDGRRLIPLNPERPMQGWRLANFDKYSMQVHRANDASRQRAKRAAAHEEEDEPAPIALSTPKPKVRFTPPTIEEVAAHLLEKGYRFTARAFVAYYEARGWKAGRVPMKSWKAACVTWAQRDEAPAIVQPRSLAEAELLRVAEQNRRSKERRDADAEKLAKVNRQRETLLRAVMNEKDEKKAREKQEALTMFEHENGLA
jgi:hypothetical protein